MNTVDFSKAGGFPMETETLDEMQKSYKLLQAFGDLVGSKSIIKGCKLAGNTVSDGVIYWNGEVLEFKGGLAETKIVIIETLLSVPFEDGDLEMVYKTRYATFGTGIDESLWSDFKRAYPLTSALVIDEIKMYVGDLNKIPWGWYIADGQNGTIDFRDRFPIPYNSENPDYDTIGKVGGLKEVTLTESQMPKHSHSGNTSYSGSHSHNIAVKLYNENGHPLATASGAIASGNINGYEASSTWTTSNGGGSHSHSITTNTKGDDSSHENRPPFKVAVFIQFKGI